MPAGHLVHYYAASQRHGLLGETAVSSPQGKPEAAALLDGAHLKRIGPHGKHVCASTAMRRLWT